MRTEYTSRAGEWLDEYEKKKCSADEAVTLIKSGQHILIAMAAGRPEHVIEALVRNYKNYENVHIAHGVALGPVEYAKEGYEGHLIYEGLFLSKNTRDAVNEDRADFYPHHMSEVPGMIRRGVIKDDVFLVQVTPPDEHGFMSSGTVGDVIRDAVETAGTVIVQVNREVPRTYGDNLIHVSEVDAVVEFDEPLPISPLPSVTEVEEEIGRNCASLVEDGSTLQLGIGAIPDAVLRALSGKKDLGVHTEMFSDGVMELCKAGVINNSKKSMDRGRMVAGFIMGTDELYDFLNNNPQVCLGNASYINDPFTIAKCSKMVCINSCIEVDIMGQVVSGSAGERQISGAGGQLDFASGANMSLDRKGKNIIAMTSTRVKNGVVSSRIVPLITPGSSVTLTRQDAAYIVTEFGIADLRRKNMEQRARELIGISHPDFREQLIEEFEMRFKKTY